MKMVTTNQAQELLAARGVTVSYPTIAQWVREGRFDGAQRDETERGPVWRIPLASVKSFEPPKMGRPAAPQRAAGKASTKNSASSRTAKTTRKLNRAFRKATEAVGTAGKKRGGLR